MSLPLQGKVALITGGSKGIGASIATLLSSQGASVVINYSSNGSSADALVEKIGASQAIAIKADAGDVISIDRLVNATVEKFGRIDILIANAGTMPMKTISQISEADFDAIYALNVKGPMFLAQKALPHMPSGSRIIFVSTSLTTASTVAPPYLLYNTTKGAIEQLVRVLAKELGPKGITVNAVAPGPTATDLFMKGKSEEMLGMVKKGIPMGRIGEADEVAEVFAWLAGEGGRWVSGQVVRANGGMC